MANLINTILPQIGSAVGSAAGVPAAVQSAETTIAKAEQRLEDVADKAEIYAVVTLGLQALAAFAALGILVVHVNSLHHMKKRRRVANNPRRRKSR